MLGWLVCWWKGEHVWVFEGGIMAECSRCHEKEVYVGDLPR
jgi:hypothetical protein